MTADSDARSHPSNDDAQYEHGEIDCLVRFSQSHEEFRLPELRALADLHHINLEVLCYNPDSPHCIVRLPSRKAARNLICRSILAWAIYELWGEADDYDHLHNVVRSNTTAWWPLYKSCSFKFSVESFRGAKTAAEQLALVESFSYLGFDGRIQMKAPDQEFAIFEEYDHYAKLPRHVFFGRLLAQGARNDANKYTLKKRRYLSTTSMDAELALVGSNLTLARPGTLFYDPFVGTASLTIACSHHGSLTLGSDLDGRTLRGSPGRNVLTSYQQYGLAGRYLDGFISDLTNTPLRIVPGSQHVPIFDGIVCDPPYGVREGLKVLGKADGSKEIRPTADGRFAHLAEDYVPPKRLYSFEALLADILDFAALTLVVGGRLSFWMPTANDDDVALGIPTHAALDIVSVCTQPFNKWSRRLLTYRRRAPEEYQDDPTGRSVAQPMGKTADELNRFRKRYFEGFTTNKGSAQG